MSNTFVYSAIRGSSGYSGLTGNTGVQGAQGTSGYSGFSGISGANATTVSVTYSNSFTAGQAIYRITGGYALGQANSVSAADILGVVTSSTGTAFTYVANGYATGFTGLVDAANYYLSETTAGALTTNPPSAVGMVIKPVLIAIGSTAAQIVEYPGAQVQPAGSNSGYSGFSGLKGSTGAQGATGTTGAQGAAGTTGAQGAQGTAGTNGIQGAQGASGYSGFSGAFAGTGTSGYIPRFTGASSLGNSLIQDNGSTVTVNASTLVQGTLSATTGANFATSSGNVGIGTATPGAKLDIVAGSGLALSFGTTVANNPLFINTYAGYTGIGMDSTTAGLRLAGDSSSGSNPLVDIGYYSSASVAHANWVSRLKVSNNGAILFNGSTGSSGQILQSNGNAAPTWVSPSGLSVGNASTAVGLVYADGPRDLSNRLPNWNTRSVYFDFVNAGTANGSGNYGGVMTYTPWMGTTASTGDSSYQLAFANNSGVNASGMPKLSIRNGIDSTWNAWYVMIHSGNIGSYTSSVTSLGVGTTASGTTGEIRATGNLYGNAFATVPANSSYGGINLVAPYTNHSGYVEFLANNGVRQGYIGYSDTTGSTDTGRISYQSGTHQFIGNVGIGTSSPAQKVEVNASANSQQWISLRNLNSGSGSSMGLLLGNDANSAFGSIFCGSTSYSSFGGASSINLGTYSTTPLVFFTNNAERARIDSSGNLGIGTSSPAANLHVVGSSIIANSTGINPDSYANTVVAGAISFPNGWGVISAIGGNAGTGGSWALGHNGGGLFFGMGDGASTNTQQTYIQMMPNRNIFLVPTSGNVGIGTSSPAYKLDTLGTSRIVGNLIVQGQTDAATLQLYGNNPPTNGAWSIASKATRSLTFTDDYQGTERARIDASGRFLLNTTTMLGGISSQQLNTGGDCFQARLDASGSAFTVIGTASTSTAAYFITSSGVCGTITCSGTNTAYNTSSDYRRKSNVKDLTGSGTFIDSLKPRTFDWDTGDKGVGFIAHEFAEVSPSSVVGEKDAVDSDGNPVYQCMQASTPEVIANLVAELQSVRQRLAALETR